MVTKYQVMMMTANSFKILIIVFFRTNFVRDKPPIYCSLLNSLKKTARVSHYICLVKRKLSRNIC